MNPYEPPRSDVGEGDRSPTGRRPASIVLLALTLIQLVWLLSDFGMLYELVRTGSLSLPAGLFRLVGCALLYAGAVRFAANAARGNFLFLGAAALLVLSVSSWEYRYLSAYPYAMAMLLCGAGAWLSWPRKSARQAPRIEPR